MESALLVTLFGVLLSGAQADVTGTNPASGSCLCINAASVNIRATACGTVIGSANSGQCFRYLGNKQTCSLSGVSYEFFRFSYGSGEGWTAGTYLNLGQASQCSSGSGQFTDRCMKCICQVESNCNANIGCVMDVGSLSCGAYQIKDPYWQDCGRPGTGWQACANTLACSETCVKAYMARYGTYCSNGATPNCETYARVHNGGPLGCRNSATVNYWTKVRTCCGSQTACD